MRELHTKCQSRMDKLILATTALHQTFQVFTFKVFTHKKNIITHYSFISPWTMGI